MKNNPGIKIVQGKIPANQDELQKCHLMGLITNVCSTKIHRCSASSVRIKLLGWVTKGMRLRQLSIHGSCDKIFKTSKIIKREKTTLA